MPDLNSNIFNKYDFFLDDVPVSNNTNDKFNRTNFSNVISNIILSKTNPQSLVIGIYGAWGEGKTTVLNFIENRLKQYPNIICVRFNPWRFNDETYLFHAFFKTIADILDHSITSYKEKIGQWLMHYARILAPISINLPFIFEFSPSESINNVAKSLSMIKLDEIKKRVENLLSDEKKQLVVLIDDIDRLDKAEIQNLFKLVKLSADFKHTTYILAFDEEIVSLALSERYGYSNLEFGRKFLEKIIQVPLYLPKADKLSLRKYFFECINEVLIETKTNLSEAEAQMFVLHYIYGFETKIKTPRMIKNYRNALVFSLLLLRDKVNILDLMLIEGIRILYPNLYETIRDNPELFMGLKLNVNSEIVREIAIDIINSVSFVATSEEQDAIKYLIKILFPKFYCFLENKEYNFALEAKWEQEKRICSEEYFNYYFAYSINDTLENYQVEQVLNFIENCNNEEEIINRLQKFLINNSENLIMQLIKKEKKMSETQKIKLALVLSKCGNLFKREYTPFAFITSFSQAAILISQCIQSIKDMKVKLNIALDVIKNSTPLPFSFECFKWLKNINNFDNINIFTLECEHELSKTMLNKIKDHASMQPIYISYPYDAISILKFWAHLESVDETTNYIKSTFENDNEKNVYYLLNCFLNSYVKHSDNFFDESSHYLVIIENISKIVKPQVIYDALMYIYKNKLNNITDKNEDQLARLFLNAYNFYFNQKN